MTNVIRHVAITYDCNRNCPYCYAKYLSKHFQEMPLENFSKVLDWFESQKIREFNLIGGEPTFHSKISEFFKLIKDRNFKVNVFTNALFKDINKILFDCINIFTINYNPPRYYSEKERVALENNMNNINNKGLKIIFAHNIFSRKISFNYIIDACIKYNVTTINYNLAGPNPSRENEFVNIKEYAFFKKYILSFISKAYENGIKTRLTRPIPLCMFNEQERLFMMKRSNLMGACVPALGVYLINPDLSVYPCTTLQLPSSRKLNINNIKSEKDIGNFYKDEIKDLKWNKVLFERCKGCKFFLRKRCQGTCLVYKYLNN